MHVNHRRRQVDRQCIANVLSTPSRTFLSELLALYIFEYVLFTYIQILHVESELGLLSPPSARSSGPKSISPSPFQDRGGRTNSYKDVSRQPLACLALARTPTFLSMWACVGPTTGKAPPLTRPSSLHRHYQHTTTHKTKTFRPHPLRHTTATPNKSLTTL